MRQLRMIWMALMGGVASYTAVVFVLVSLGTLALGSLPANIVNAAAGGVLVYMALGVAIRRTMLARLPPDGDDESRLTHYRSAVLIPLALMESGGLVIITLGMLSSSPTWVLAGGGAALAMMWMSRPNATEAGLAPEA